MVASPAELTYFLEVSSVLNLSRASERLGISQPSLSLAIKRLEQSLGVELFIRHKNGVSLTVAGKQLVLDARVLLEYWEKTKVCALAFEQEVQGHFTLGCPSTVAIYLVSLFIADLLSQYPKLQLHIRNDISRKITEQVVNLSIDIGIVVNPFRHPDLIITKLCNDEFGFWVGDDTRDIGDFSKKALLICVPELSQTEFLLKKAAAAGMHADRIMHVGSMEVAAKLASSGCGIGILPRRVALALYPDKLKPVPDAPTHADEVCLIYRHENRKVAAIGAIISAITGKDVGRTSVR